jgi:hypothetical protein
MTTSAEKDDMEETGLNSDGDEYDADELDDPNEPSITPDAHDDD